MLLKLQYFVHGYEESAHLKDPDAAKDWRQKENTAAEDVMIG